MPTSPIKASSVDAAVDVVIVGAGFSGLYLLHRMRKQGLSTRCFERGDGVGGTCTSELLSRCALRRGKHAVFLWLR